MYICKGCRKSLGISLSFVDSSIARARVSLAIGNKIRSRGNATTAVAVENGTNTPYTPVLQDDGRSSGSIARVIKRELRDQDKSRLRTELMYLRDPAKLNTRVRYYLAKEDLQKAISLLRMASANTPCTIAWNGIVDYVASRREFQQAIKVFNEMKKRGQFPDAFTYSLLFRALAQEPVHKARMEMSNHLYKSLEAENTKVKKNAFLINCALQVCMNAGDWDAMWEIASDFAEDGPCAPDASSYSVMLDGLAKHYESLRLTDPTRGEQLSRTLRDAEKIWQDMQRRHSSRKIQLDERAVGNYLRIIMLQPSKDSSMKVLETLESAFSIPYKTSSGSSGTEAAQASGGARGRKQDFAASGEKAGNILLSLVVRAYIDLLPTLPKDMRPITSYWDTIVGRRDIQPDLNNYHWLLRYSMYAGDSASALSTVEKVMSGGGRGIASRQGSQATSRNLVKPPNRTTWILALKACAVAMESGSFAKTESQEPRTADAQAFADSPTELNDDWSTSSVSPPADLKEDARTPMRHAQAIFKIMKENTSTKQPKPMKSYLSTALCTRDVPLILMTIEDLQPQMDSLRNQLFRSSRGEQDPSELDVWSLNHLTVDTIKVLTSSKALEVLAGDADPAEKRMILARADKVKDWSFKLKAWQDAREAKFAGSLPAEARKSKVRAFSKDDAVQTSDESPEESASSRGKAKRAAKESKPPQAWAHLAAKEYKQLKRLQKQLYGGWTIV